MTTDPFTTAAEHEADLVTEDGDNAANGGFVAGALWARTHLAVEVRKAKAEALREAAGPEWGNNNTLWSGPRVRAKINRRAAEYETGDSDEHR